MPDYYYVTATTAFPVGPQAEAHRSVCTLSVDLIARCSQLNGLLGRSGRRTAPDGMVSVVPDVTAQLPTSSVAVKAKDDPASDRLVDKAGPCPRPEPAECHRVARPTAQHLSASGHQGLRASGRAAKAIAKIVDERPYPIDVQINRWMT